MIHPILTIPDAEITRETCPTCEGRGGGKQRLPGWPARVWCDCITCDGAGTCTPDEAAEARELGHVPYDGE